MPTCGISLFNGLVIPIGCEPQNAHHAADEQYSHVREVRSGAVRLPRALRIFKWPDLRIM